MATQNLSAQAEESKGSEPKYHSRYGIMTASDTALKLLDRARFKAEVIGTLFEACRDTGVTIPDYEVCGLAYILEDIGHDISTAYDYYFGDDDAPGKMFDIAWGKA